jgi:hypothetical protein
MLAVALRLPQHTSYERRYLPTSVSDHFVPLLFGVTDFSFIANLEMC